MACIFHCCGYSGSLGDVLGVSMDTFWSGSQMVISAHGRQACELCSGACWGCKPSCDTRLGLLPYEMGETLRCGELAAMSAALTIMLL